ncbi:MAG: Na/Pi cotransporter family protein [Firmicutes bacterium]|nr:Na/Pi cotransporter family protein [Bacillota bacterium]MDY5855874.1 Na/Pi cotransporter family protein [Anaerovoracaceae bacterium]
MDIFSVITLLGGLAMFLYGMEVMGDGLKNASGSALKSVLGKATQNIVFGVITGMLVTAVIQSSTATIVLTVGLISAGILNLKQATSIVMGANIGTTVTAQIIRLMDIDSTGSLILEFFKPSTLAPLALIAGIILILFVKSSKSNTVGEICVGFGILFSGLMNMTAAVEPLSESQEFMDIMQKFGDQPVLALLVGLVMTVIVQSSSAMVGMIQALSVTGAMTFNLVYPMIMGINLGTCVTTAMVCSIGSSKDAKRTGIVHIAFNVIGTIAFMIVMTVIKAAGGLPELWGSIVDSGGIANFQTLFNVLTAIALIPFAGFLVKLSMAIVKPDPQDEEDRADLRVPDAKLYEVPAMALGESNKAIARMGEVALKNLKRSCILLMRFEPDRIDVINKNEDNLDQFTDQMDTYLVNLSKYVETDSDNQYINILMQGSTNFERIGDHAVNIMEAAQTIDQERIQFTREAREELKVVRDAVLEITAITVDAFGTMSYDGAKRIEPLEEVIDDMVVTLKDRHINRLKAGNCSTTSGMMFIDLLTNLERIADQCSNIALLILSQKDKSILGNHHGYVRELHKGGDVTYDAELIRQKEHYLPLLNHAEHEE